MIVAALSVVAVLTILGEDRKRLCGRDYHSASELLRELRGDSGASELMSPSGILVFFDRKDVTLWWFSDPSSPNPIITCRSKKTSDIGYLSQPVQADCEGDRTGACAAQAAAMASVKF